MRILAMARMGAHTTAKQVFGMQVLQFTFHLQAVTRWFADPAILAVRQRAFVRGQRVVLSVDRFDAIQKEAQKNNCACGLTWLMGQRKILQSPTLASSSSTRAYQIAVELTSRTRDCPGPAALPQTPLTCSSAAGGSSASRSNWPAGSATKKPTAGAPC
jgi:hypothetical protein